MNINDLVTKLRPNLKAFVNVTALVHNLLETKTKMNYDLRKKTTIGKGVKDSFDSRTNKKTQRYLFFKKNFKNLFITNL